MLLLVLACSSRKLKKLVEGDSGKGVKFWSAMYIPIIVAMAARQNVVAAVNGGMVALAAGVMAVIACFSLVPVLSKLGSKRAAASKDNQETSTDESG
jgi:malonate transporter MadL subunit